MPRLLFIARKITSNTLGYGLLYNWLTTQGAIAPIGWHVPTYTEGQTLISASGGATIAGGKLKEIGLTHWITPNYNAVNEFGFSAVGAGFRVETGSQGNFKNIGIFWLNTANGVDNAYASYASYTLESIVTTFYSKKRGYSIRLIKDDPTGWVAGDTVTDADGNVYQTVKIGDQVWTASNWKCTKWNDGSPINYVESNAAWAAATSPAWCNVNGDPANK